MDYTLSDFNPETGIMQPILTYYGRRRQVEKMDGVVVHWPNNGSPPPDVPYCGFSGEALHCINRGKIDRENRFCVAINPTVLISPLQSSFPCGPLS